MSPSGGSLPAAPVADILAYRPLDLRRISEEAMTLDVTGHYHRHELFDFLPIRTGKRDAGAG